MGKAAAAGAPHTQQQPEQQQLPQVRLSPKKLRPQLINSHMLLVPGVLSVPEAQALIDAATHLGFEHQSSRGPAFGEAFRDNHRISMHDPGLADQLWRVAGLERVMQGVEVDGLVPVGLNPHIRYYRYSVGQRFGKHVDDSVPIEGAPAGTVTGYTLLIYLSGTPLQQQGPIDVSAPKATANSNSSSSSSSQSSKAKRQKQQAPAPAAAASSSAQQVNTSALQQLVGGETVFFDYEGRRSRVVASVRPAAGLALLHLHGEDRCLEHEANVVLEGTKYVLRSDVVFAPPGTA